MKQKKLTKLLIKGGLPHNVATAIAYNAVMEAKAAHVKRINRLTYDYYLDDSVPLDVMSKKHIESLYRAIKETLGWFNSDSATPFKVSSVVLSITEFLNAWGDSVLPNPWRAADTDPYNKYDVVGLGFDGNYNHINTQLPVFGDPTEWPTEVRAVVVVDWSSSKAFIYEIDEPLLYKSLVDGGFIN